MNQAIHRLRLFFCFFSGEDDYIIRKCEAGIQISFALIGVFVMLIFIGCWISASLFMSHLFEDSKWMSLFVGIIWALLVANLYLLVLYTIAPTLLPIARHSKAKKISLEGSDKEKKEKRESAFTTSFIFRLSLISLLAIIIAQPFNVFIFSNQESEKYAETLRNLFSHHPSAWGITILVCLLFLLPVYWKYAIRNRSGFYERKRHIENKFVHDHYLEFKEVYASVFNEKISLYNRQTWENTIPFLNRLEKANEESCKLYYELVKAEILHEPITKYEYWTDPPFRTQSKISNKQFLSEEDLLKTFYQENN